MQVVGIDVGRDWVKVVGPNKELKFRSMVGEWRARRLTAGGDYEVEIDGERFFVADLAEESYFRRTMVTESKVHQETKILFLTALALVASPGEKIAIVTGVPVIQHTPEGKNALINLLKGLYMVKIKNYQGAYLIEDIGIVAESAGAYWDVILGEDGRLSNPWLSEQLVRVIDIGSRTVNFCTVRRRQFLDRESGSLGYGMLELNNAGGEDLEEEIKGEFARRIVADLARRWLDYRKDRDIVLLAGGGAIALEPWLKEHFPLYQMAFNPIFANARGFRKMGVAKWAAGRNAS